MGTINEKLKMKGGGRPLPRPIVRYNREAPFVPIVSYNRETPFVPIVSYNRERPFGLIVSYNRLKKTFWVDCIVQSLEKNFLG